MNGDRLTEWAFMVKHTTGGRERVGAVRRCQVEFGGRPGSVVETCVECVPPKRIAWVMAEDSFGFGRMFADLGFAFALEPIEKTKTRLVNETFFRPKTMLARLMAALMIRRKFAAVRRRILENLRLLAERSIPASSAGAPPS